MRVKFFVLGVLMLSIIKINAQQGTGSTLTLQQSIETAIANNLDVKLTALNMDRAYIDRRQAKGNMIPTLNADILHGINQGRNINPFTNTYSNDQLTIADYSLFTNVTIFNGFRLLNAMKQTALAYDASKMELEQAKYELTLNVILAYLQILSNEDQLMQAKSQVALSQKQVERLEALHKEGAIPPAQMYDIRGQMANDQLAVVNSENALQASKLELAQLMNVPYSKDLTIERLNADQFTMLYEGDAESIFQSAMQQLVMIKATELRKQSAEKGVKAARGGLAPNLYFTASISTDYSSAGAREVFSRLVTDTPGAYVTVNGNNVDVIFPKEERTSQKINYMDQIRNNYGTFVGVGVRIPILNNFRAKNQVSLAKIDLKNAEYIAQTTQIQLKQSIEQAYFNMKAAQERYRVLQEQVNAFTESFRAAEVRFSAGLGTSVDYLIARTNLDRANINLVSARYDYVLRTKILDYYQSKPLW